VAKTSINTEELKAATVGILVTELKGLAEASEDDLRNYAVQIVQDAAEAAATGDQAVLAQLDDQRKLLLEINRVRVVDTAWNTFSKVVNAVLGVLIKTLLPA
jgi:hypothetical protein